MWLQREKCFSHPSRSFRPEILRKYFPPHRMSVGISSVYSGTAQNRKSQIAQAEGERGGLSRELFPFRPSPFSHLRSKNSRSAIAPTWRRWSCFPSDCRDENPVEYCSRGLGSIFLLTLCCIAVSVTRSEYWFFIGFFAANVRQ